MSSNPPPDPPMFVGQVVTFTLEGPEDSEEHNAGAIAAPAMITAISVDTVNLRVFCNGPRVLFRSGVIKGTGPGQWKNLGQ